MSEEKVTEMFVPYECWYIRNVDIDEGHREQYKKYSLYALLDNQVSNNIIKEFNCFWSPRFKKLTISVKNYEDNIAELNRANIYKLMKIDYKYTYVAPPCKTGAEQIEELIRIMSEETTPIIEPITK